MYANDNSEQFPTGGSLGSTASLTTTALQERYSLGKLYDAYVTDRKIFRCPSDSAVSETNVLTLTTTVTTFTASTCSYGYDDNHTASNDPGVAIAADRQGTDTAGVDLSDNHSNKGQNVLYLDGHVEWKGTATCGYYGTSTIGYDNIWTATGGAASGAGGTDTAILQ